MVVLGIDVGLKTSGYVLCNLNGVQIELVDDGDITTSSASQLPQRIGNIYDFFEQLIIKYRPEAVVLEKLYSHHRHPTTVGALSQVRGIMLLLINKYGLDFFEYSPTRARKAFMGKGNTNSDRVKRMAENILGRNVKSEHAADAFSLIVALSHDQKKKEIENVCKNQRKISKAH